MGVFQEVRAKRARPEAVVAKRECITKAMRNMAYRDHQIQRGMETISEDQFATESVSSLLKRAMRACL